MKRTPNLICKDCKHTRYLSDDRWPKTFGPCCPKCGGEEELYEENTMTAHTAGKEKHTPTPWGWETQYLPEDLGRSNGVWITHNKLPIASMVEVGAYEANARHIVKCVNNHEVLIDTINLLLETIDDNGINQEYPEVYSAVKHTRRILENMEDA